MGATPVVTHARFMSGCGKSGSDLSKRLMASRLRISITLTIGLAADFHRVTFVPKELSLFIVWSPAYGGR